MHPADDHAVPCVCAETAGLEWLQIAASSLTVARQLFSCLQTNPLLAAQLRLQVEAVHRSDGKALAAELRWLFALFRLRASLWTLEGEHTSLPSSQLFHSFLKHAYEDRFESINKLLQTLANWFALAEEQGSERRRAAQVRCSSAGFVLPDEAPLDHADLFLQEMLLPPSHSCRKIKRKCFELVSPRLRAIKAMCASQQRDLSLQLRTYLHSTSSDELKQRMKRDLEPSPPSTGDQLPPTPLCCSSPSPSLHDDQHSLNPLVVSRSSSSGGSTHSAAANEAAASVESAWHTASLDEFDSSLPVSKKHKGDSNSPSTEGPHEDAESDDNMIDETHDGKEERSDSDETPTRIPKKLAATEAESSPTPSLTPSCVSSQSHVHSARTTRNLPLQPKKAAAVAASVEPISQTKPTGAGKKRNQPDPASSQTAPVKITNHLPARPVASTLSDEPWQASCANDFRELMQRYPRHFASAPRVLAAAADTLLLSSDPMDAAFIVTNLMVHAQHPVPQFKATELAGALVNDSVTKVIHQQDGDGELKLLYDTVDEPSTAAKAPAFKKGKQYFVSDMILHESNELMKSVGSNLPDCPMLRDALYGGLFQYVASDPELELPHGVGDWTTTHFLHNQSAEQLQNSPFMPRAYHPIYFHVETHLSGAINWRAPDVRISVVSNVPSVLLATVSAASAAAPGAAAAAAAAGIQPAPAYWICPVPDGDNLRRFNQTMAQLPSVAAHCSATGLAYSLQNRSQPSIVSLEPLLRAGICFLLVRQFENDLVVLAPGTPHFVLTPAAATKISRNWMTPEALLHAVHRAMRKESSERSEWIPSLSEKPLLFLARSLQGLRTADPKGFQRLMDLRGLSLKLHIALSDMQSSNEPHIASELRAIAASLQSSHVQSLSELVASSSARLPASLLAPPLPPYLSATEVAAEQERMEDARVEDLLDELHRQLPLGIVTALPGMKQARRNPGRQRSEVQMQWTRRENQRRLKEAQTAARKAFPPPAVNPQELQLLLDSAEHHG